MIELGADKKASHDRGGDHGSHRRGSLPFDEIVGQEALKRGLLAVAANDDLDGLLIRGAKGTAKSTAVRGLADLLPSQTVVEGCPYGCPPDDPGLQCADCRSRPRADLTTTERAVPVVTLPLSATRERVVGTLSVADALAGEYEFDPGVLARANRGILYVDEVNLLGDHLVDTLLDAAASGVNRVERDGVSVAHPASFTLVGTMNPEEGDLRPQLRDRFALQTTVTGCDSIDDRVAIIDRALGDEGDGAETQDGTENAGTDDSENAGTDETENAGANDADTDASRRHLRRARRRLPDVTLPRSFREEIAELCRDAGVEGHRGDIATARAARTFAALADRGRVLESDVREAATFALPHRLRSDPFDSAPDPEDLIDHHFEADGDEETPEDAEQTDESRKTGERREETGEDDGEAGEGDERAGKGEEGASEGDERASEGEASRNDEGEGPGAEQGDADHESTDEDDDGPDAADRGAADAPDDTSRSGGSASGGEHAGGEPESDGEHADAEGDSDEGSVDEGSVDEANDGAESDGEREERSPIVPGQSRAAIGRGRAPDISLPDSGDAGGSDPDPSAGSGSGPTTPPTTNGDVAGPRVRSEPADATAASGDVDVGASLRAATRRGSTSIESRDLRRSVRRGDADVLVTFAVDASASMRPAMRAAKGVVLELLRDAYEGREEVAFVAFAGTDADVLLPPTDDVGLAARHLKDLPTGDRTPLPAGLRTAATVVRRADPAAGVVVVVTDGRANVADGSPSAETRAAARELAETGAHVVVVEAGSDAEHGDAGGDRRSNRDRSSLIGPLLEATGGERVPLSALSAERIDGTVADVYKG
ncbi:VWA domain-containing protein [haloarchaeon 3A1-DGR]|nr:VWA domain-containing protein [haloarchaeon 3A1-DGR]